MLNQNLSLFAFWLPWKTSIKREYCIWTSNLKISSSIPNFIAGLLILVLVAISMEKNHKKLLEHKATKLLNCISTMIQTKRKRILQLIFIALALYASNWWLGLIKLTGMSFKKLEWKLCYQIKDFFPKIALTLSRNCCKRILRKD